MPPVRAEVVFDAIRVWFGDVLHAEIRRSTYRGLYAWKWDGNYGIDVTTDGGRMRLQYTTEALWLAVLKALAALPLSEGEA